MQWQIYLGRVECCADVATTAFDDILDPEWAVEVVEVVEVVGDGW